MKQFLWSIFFILLTFAIVRWYVFSITPNDTVHDQPVTSQGIFQKERDAFVDQQLKFQGVVVESYYLLGIGYYELRDSDGYIVSVFSDNYPPAVDSLVEVVVYVRPLIKVDESITIQLEVEVPELLLSSPKTSKNLRQ